MTATLEEIRGYLDGLGYRYSFDEEEGFFSLLFNTETYRDEEGEATVRLVIYVADKGNTFGCLATGLYVVRNEPHEAAILRSLMYANALRKFVRFEMDHSGGEVLASIVIPVADSRLTEEQFRVTVEFLLTAVEETYPMIMHARETGKVSAIRPAEYERQKLVERVGRLSDESRAKVLKALDEALEKAGPLGGDEELDRL